MIPFLTPQILFITLDQLSSEKSRFVARVGATYISAVTTLSYSSSRPVQVIVEESRSGAGEEESSNSILKAGSVSEA